MSLKSTEELQHQLLDVHVGVAVLFRRELDDDLLLVLEIFVSTFVVFLRILRTAVWNRDINLLKSQGKRV